MTLRKRTVFAVTLVAPADLTISTADTLDSWVRQGCLADVANAIDGDDDLEFNSSRIKRNGY